MQKVEGLPCEYEAVMQNTYGTIRESIKNII